MKLVSLIAFVSVSVHLMISSVLGACQPKCSDYAECKDTHRCLIEDQNDNCIKKDIAESCQPHSDSKQCRLGLCQHGYICTETEKILKDCERYSTLNAHNREVCDNLFNKNIVKCHFVPKRQKAG